jgi:hypothetical protein
MGSGASSGALSGAASGASAGASFGPYGAIIGGVLGAVVGYFGGASAEKAAAKLTPQQKAIFDMVTQNAKNMSEAGNMLLSLSKGPIASTTNYLQAAASGDHNSILELASKDLKGVSEGARQSLQTMSQLMPRTGASAQFLSDIPYSTQSKQQDIMMDTRNNARQQLGQFGLQLAGTGGQLISGANQPGENMLGFTQNMRDSAFNRGSQVAGGIYDMFNQVWNNAGAAYTNYRNNRTPKVPASASSFFGGNDSLHSGD